MLESSALTFNFYSPADFILDAISVDHRSTELQTRTEERVARILSAWRGKTNLAQQTRSTLELSEEDNLKQTTAPFYKAFVVVLSRSFK